MPKFWNWHLKILFYICQIWSPELSWGDLSSSANKKCCLSWMSLKKGNENLWWTWIGRIYPSVITRGLLKTKAFYLSLTVCIHKITDFLFLFWCRFDRYSICLVDFVQQKNTSGSTRNYTVLGMQLLGATLIFQMENLLAPDRSLSSEVNEHGKCALGTCKSYDVYTFITCKSICHKRFAMCNILQTKISCTKCLVERLVRMVNHA